MHFPGLMWEIKKKYFSFSHCLTFIMTSLNFFVLYFYYFAAKESFCKRSKRFTFIYVLNLQFCLNIFNIFYFLQMHFIKIDRIFFLSHNLRKNTEKIVKSQPCVLATSFEKEHPVRNRLSAHKPDLVSGIYCARGKKSLISVDSCCILL